MKRNIFITGFSGTGKSVIGREVADRLGWRYVDIDQEIVNASGKPIDIIFREEGEAHFRMLEHHHLTILCKNTEQVVSTGGGIVTNRQNQILIEQAGIVVCLEAKPETIHDRLFSQSHGSESQDVRPLLEDPEPLQRILDLKAKRQADYSNAQWTVHTDYLSPSESAEEIVRAWMVLSKRFITASYEHASDLAAIVQNSTGEYPVWISWGILKDLGQRVSDILSPDVAYIVADEGATNHARITQSSLEASGIPSHIFFVPPGEKHKNLQTAHHIYNWLADRRAERGHLILAVGGGMVCDLAGFVAATFLRGLRFGLIPTSLLAMMDAAIGGKTAVDLSRGKNLVGAFYHPQFVIADVQTLETLPKRELASGWAEAIKHGLILDEKLLHSLGKQRIAAMALDKRIATDLVRQSVAIKAKVVSRDEKETSGLRVLLNYGHTIGHALESTTNYSAYLHGEAVSLGMMGAAFISNALGMLSLKEVDRQRSILQAYDLPVDAINVDWKLMQKAMMVDKKIVGGSINWVLLERIGKAVTRRDVDKDLVEKALKYLAEQQTARHYE